MTDERDQYREAYRSAREGLSLLSEHLTEPERDAILREAARKARQKENFCLAVVLIGGPVIYLLFDAISSISQFKVLALIGYGVISYLMTTIRNRRSRIRCIAKEVMAVLKRKRLRPPRCICCESLLMDNGSPACSTCGCELAEKTRRIN